MEEDYVRNGIDWFRIIDLQMEGSSGSPGPSGGKSLSDWAQAEFMLKYLADTNYEVKNLEVLTYNS
jgi:hypothetical protein